jgi:hypothetical protein
MFINRARLMLYGWCLLNGIIVGVGVWTSDVFDPPVFDTPTATAACSSGVDSIADDNDNDEPTTSRSNRGHRARAVTRPLLAIEISLAGGQWGVLAGAQADILPTRAVWPCATTLESLQVRLQM